MHVRPAAHWSAESHMQPLNPTMQKRPVPLVVPQLLPPLLVEFAVPPPFVVFAVPPSVAEFAVPPLPPVPLALPPFAPVPSLELVFPEHATTRTNRAAQTLEYVMCISRRGGPARSSNVTRRR